MKRISYILTVVASLLLWLSCTNKQVDRTSFVSMQQVFQDVPDSLRLAVYWYWISDNISEEGVIKDLEAMKKVGINRAYIGNIGQEEIAYGKHKILSEEWWKITHAALKKATELDIEIGIFNSPGWSQSGGPWVKPEESMRYLSSSEVLVNGPLKFEGSLPEVGKNAQDVKVIAYPLSDVEYEMTKKSIKKKAGSEYTLNIPVSGQQPMRNISIKVDKPTLTSAKLYYKDEGGYKLLKDISIDRSNPDLIVGFIPFAPIVVSLPEVKTSEYKLIIDPRGEATFQVLLSSEPMVERYAEKTLAKMFQTPLPLWHDYLWDGQPEVSDAQSLISPDKVIDITSNFSNGRLNWDVPEGKWKIVRTAMLSTEVTNGPASPEGRGLEIDKMSKEHVITHFDAFIGEILRRIPAEDRKSFKVVVQDSYETGGQNWTDDMIERFEQTYGYSPVPYLPVLGGAVVGSRDISDRFLWDLRRLIADRVAYDYVGGLRNESYKHGLTTWLENYGHWGFPGEFLQYGGQSDEIGGEFWSEGSLGDIENKAASSCGHIYGKPRIWAESFTSGGPVFSRYPYLMKNRGDRFFTEGINSTLLHLYIHQPYEDKNPGISAWFGNEFNRKNTWFFQMDLFVDYLKRCNYMLQQGQYIADVAYFIGEDTPKMTGVCDPELPKGYSFDYINAEVLLNYASVKEGKLCLESGMEYKVLVLPRQTTMRPELLAKISDMVRDGLVILGPEPQSSPSLANYPQADEKVRAIASEMWNGVENNGHKNFGKGYVFGENNSLENVFSTLSVIPDCKIEGDSENILFIHRALEEGDVYFISNQEEENALFHATFRVSEGTPELWDAVTGEIRALPQYKVNDSQSITLPMELNPKESAFIVFNKNKKRKEIKDRNFPEGFIISEITTPWEVSFDGMSAPLSPVVFEKLSDLKDSPDPMIKYFSGLTTYKTSFNMLLEENKDFLSGMETYVDLNKVMVTAKVYLNDNYVGGVWTYPYRLNITEYLKEGENTLRIEVANNWMNRMIGDLNLPESQRRVWTTVNPWNASSELQSSGLLGPVTLKSFDYQILE